MMMALDSVKKIKHIIKSYKYNKMNKTAKGIIISVSILLFGMLGMFFLASLKKDPDEIKIEQPVLQVEVIRAEKGTYPVYLSAYGEAESVRVVPLASEISGKVTHIHPKLEDGETVKKGDLLFKVDPRSYELIIKSGRARLTILQKTRKIAGKEFQRVKNLYEQNRIGTLSGVEAAEKSWLAAAEMENRVKQIVETAELNLDKCEVRAGFTGRLSNVSIEKGQFVVAGKHVLTLIDDSILEIKVSFDCKEAGKWLNVKKGSTTGWFKAVKQEPCEIRWAENQDVVLLKGILHRIVEYDRKTRMVTLAIQTTHSEKQAFDNSIENIVDGMFCSVKIPGKPMTNVVRLPRSLLSIENTVYAVRNNRLKTVAVNVLRTDEDYVYIKEGIADNDLVVATRLVNPLEKSIVNIVNPG